MSQRFVASYRRFILTLSITGSINTFYAGRHTYVYIKKNITMNKQNENIHEQWNNRIKIFYIYLNRYNLNDNWNIYLILNINIIIYK